MAVLVQSDQKVIQLILKVITHGLKLAQRIWNTGMYSISYCS